METVEVVIRIPKEKYKLLTEMGDCVLNHNERAIKHGTVLPKGHGRLIDADIATKDVNAFIRAFAMYTDNMGKYNIVCAAPTVIEADRGDENG